MERCVPFTIEEGYPQDRAVAICLKKYETKEGDDEMNDDKSMYAGEVAGVPMEEEMATSFAELEKARDARCKIQDMAGMTADYNMLVKNIMASPLIEDKPTAMKALVEEFAERFQEQDIEMDEKAVWSTAYVNDLPDSAFLYIGPGGKKDGEGKTTPRSLRKFPYKDADGKVDLPHIRNAIARIPQATGISAEQKTQLQEKARRILEREQSKSEKGMLETIKGWFEDLKGVILGRKEEEVDTAYTGPLMKTFKARDGKAWIVLWTTNAFIDREDEIFTTKAIDDFIHRHEDDDVKGEFWFWHLPKSKFGDIRLQARVGRFLVEAGPFDDTIVGRTFKEFFEMYPDGHPEIAPEGWGASHGYTFNKADREDGVYDWFEKHESSVLPLVVASNPHNPKMTIKEVDSLMDAKKREAWAKEFGAEFVDTILQVGETKTAALEQSVEFKEVAVEEVQEEVVSEETEVKEEPVEEEPVQEVKEESVEEIEFTEEADTTEKEVSEEPTEPPISRKELAEALKMVVQELTDRFEKKISNEIETTVDAMVEVITPLSNQVKALAQTDEQKIAQQAQSVPTASLTAMVKENLFGDETRLDGRTTLAKDGPQEAEKKADGPVVAGTRLKLW